MKQWKVLYKGEGEKVKGKEDIVNVLLENRGLKNKLDIKTFLEPKLESVTLQKVGIDEKEVKKTLERIELAIKDNEDIVIYGDYDVDGICATAILWETIYSMYKNVYPYIPHRVDEGYGLSEKGILNLKAQNSSVGLIITVDNGIVAGKAVEYAKEQGIDVVISDHHIKGEKLPKAYSIVHTTELCGTGIAYLLAQEISKTQHNHLELVALATVADLVPLNKFNRALLKLGLEKLRKTERPGLLALFDEAKINQKEIDTYHIGHIIAPRLNASGRISHALDSLRLICTTDTTRAKKLTQTLGEVNKERQRMTFESTEDATSKVKGQKSKVESLVFVESRDYDQGVVGLIASRLVEEFYRPAIAVSVGEKISKGSARSIRGVNIIELIRSCPEFLSEAGGHPMAAGFSVETEKLEKFKNALVKQAGKIIDKKLFLRCLIIDLELEFDLINQDLYQAIQSLSPFGMGNPSPVFMTKKAIIDDIRLVGQEGKHAKLKLKNGKVELDAIAFGMGEKVSKYHIGDEISIVYSIDEQEWNGNKNLQLKVKDLKLPS